MLEEQTIANRRSLQIKVNNCQAQRWEDRLKFSHQQNKIHPENKRQNDLQNYQNVVY